MLTIILVALLFSFLNIKTSLQREEWEDADLSGPLPDHDTILPNPRVREMTRKIWEERVRNDYNNLMLRELDLELEANELIRASILVLEQRAKQAEVVTLACINFLLDQAKKYLDRLDPSNLDALINGHAMVNNLRILLLPLKDEILENGY